METLRVIAAGTGVHGRDQNKSITIDRKEHRSRDGAKIYIAAIWGTVGTCGTTLARLVIE